MSKVLRKSESLDGSSPRSRRNLQRKNSDDMKVFFRETFEAVMAELATTNLTDAAGDEPTNVPFPLSFSSSTGALQPSADTSSTTPSTKLSADPQEQDNMSFSPAGSRPSSAPSGSFRLKAPSSSGAIHRRESDLSVSLAAVNAVDGKPSPRGLASSSTVALSWSKNVQNYIAQETDLLNLLSPRAVSKKMSSLLTSSFDQLKLLSFSNAMMMETTLNNCYTHLIDAIFDAVCPDSCCVFAINRNLSDMREFRHVAYVTPKKALRVVPMTDTVATTLLNGQCRFVSIPNIETSPYSTWEYCPTFTDPSSPSASNPSQSVKYPCLLYTTVHDHTGMPLAIVESCSKQVDGFTDHDIKFITALSLLAASAIRSARLHEEMSLARRHGDALLEISQALSLEMDVQDVIDCILHVALDVVHPEKVLLYLYDEETKTFEADLGSAAGTDNSPLPDQGATTHKPGQTNKLGTHTCNVGEGIVGMCAEGSELMQIDDVEEENYAAELAEFEKVAKIKVRNMICAPVFGPKGEIVAVIKVINKKTSDGEPLDFSFEDSALISAISHGAGVAINKAVLLDSIKREQRKNKTLVQVMKAVNRAKDNVDELVQSLVNVAYEIVEVDRVALFLVDDARNELIVSVSKDKDFEGFRFPIGRGIVGTVAKSGDVMTIHDAQSDERFDKSADKATGYFTRNILCIPIRDHRNKIVAVIELLNKLQGNFSAGDVDVMETFSVEVASALKKAVLEKAFRTGGEGEDTAALIGQYSKNTAPAQAKKGGKEGKERHKTFQGGAHGAPVAHPIANSEVTISPTTQSRSILAAASAVEATNNNESPGTPRKKTAILPGTQTISMGKSGSISSHYSRGMLADGTLRNLTKESRTEAISELQRWNFDVLAYDKKTLVLFCNDMINYYDMPELFGISLDKLQNFLVEVSANYRDNPFHSYFHAVAVMHISFMMLSVASADQLLTNRDILACLIGSLCHDLDHPGTNNDFHIASLSDLAITYNDRSILENHHAAMVFRLMKNPDCDVLKCLVKEDFKYVRKVMIEVILKTDMVNHFDMVKTLQAVADRDVPAGEFAFDIDDEHDRLELACLVVHCADLSNPAYPEFEMTRQWCFRVCEEFARQAEAELKLGLPVAPYMTGLTNETSIAKLQIGFVSYVILPLWKVVGLLFPKANQQEVHCTDNVKVWQKIIDGTYTPKEETAVSSDSESASSESESESESDAEAE